MYKTLKILKTITWNDKWENCVRFGCPEEPLMFDRYGHRLQPDLPDSEDFAIIEVMSQLKEKMSVYEAYLKGVEAVFGLTTNNQSRICLQWIVALKKQEIKNLKKGIFDDELADYICAATKGYKRWYLSQNKEFK